MNENHIQRHCFFSWYGLCGDNKIFIPNNIKANIGINKKKKVKLVIVLIIYFAKLMDCFYSKE